MFATRDQENAINVRQKSIESKISKTPKPHKTPSRRVGQDENLVSKKDGKVKSVVAVLESKASNYSTPNVRTRAPLGAKTANVKSTTWQTPAQALTIRPSTKVTTPRIRKKFAVHTTQDPLHVETEDREIEYMAPRSVPLPDYPDENIWPHDRTYTQFEGNNFTQGWALKFCNDEDSDYETKIKRIERDGIAQGMRTTVQSSMGRGIADLGIREEPGQEMNQIDVESHKLSSRAPGTLASSKAAAALSRVRGVGRFAAATSSSEAKSKLSDMTLSRQTRSKPTASSGQARSKLTASSSQAKSQLTTSSSQAKSKFANETSIRNSHRQAIAASNTSLGFSNGRKVSGIKQAMTQANIEQSITVEERREVLDTFWTYSTTDDVDELLPSMSILDLDELKELRFELPDD